MTHLLASWLPDMPPWADLLSAFGLLILALILLVLEFVVVSAGLLLIASIGAFVGAIVFAFLAGGLAGWAFLVVSPILAILVVRWSIDRIQKSNLVPQGEITADAGYHHAAEDLGIAVGSRGVLVTRARPTGRARFDGGEIDIQVTGGSLEKDTPVVVKSIDGPMVYVARAEDPPASSAPPQP